MNFFLLIVVFLLFLSCTSDTDDSGGTKPDPVKTAGISPEEKAQLEAKEKELIAKAQAQQILKHAPIHPAPGQSMPSLSGALSGIPYISICGRTAQVKQAILTKLKKANCSQVIRKELEAILVLFLYDKQITTLKLGDFEGLTSLQRLYLYTNQLTSLPEGLFQGLTSLQELDLDNNQFISLPGGLFQGLISLQNLDLDLNELTSLPEGLFQGLTSLQELDLGYNKLTSLPEGLFQGLTSLQELDLGYNKFSEEEKQKIRSRSWPSGLDLEI